MPPQKVYHYSIVKLVPNPVRDEALNLGVVLVGDGGGYASYRLLSGIQSRVSALAPSFDVRLIQAFEKDLREAVGKGASQQPSSEPPRSLDLEELRRLAETHANHLQFTSPRACLALDPEKALGDLFDEFVGPPAS